MDILNDKKIQDAFAPTDTGAFVGVEGKQYSVLTLVTAYRMVQAMQKSIEKGQIFLRLGPYGQTNMETSKFSDWVPLHTDALGLPDKFFQPAEHDHARISMEHPCPQCHKTVVWKIDEEAKSHEETKYCQHGEPEFLVCDDCVIDDKVKAREGSLNQQPIIPRPAPPKPDSPAKDCKPDCPLHPTYGELKAPLVRELSNWLWNGPQKTHHEIDDKLWDFIAALGVSVEDKP